MPSDLSLSAALLRNCAASAQVNEYLVERLDPAVWRAKPPAPKMRTIAAVRALAAKRRALLAVLQPALERGVRVGHSKQHPVEFLTYYMVHDGHHRGQILLQARLLGYPISTETMSGMWLWTSRLKSSGAA